MSSKKRIVLVSNMYPDEANPQYGVFVKNFEKSINSSSTIEVVAKSVISGRSKGLNKLYKYILFIFDTYRVCKQYKDEIKYIHYGNHSLIPFLFIPLKWQVKKIVNLHGGELFPKTRTNRALLKITKSVLLTAYRYVVPSHFFKEELHAQHGVHKDCIYVSPSGGINRLIFTPPNSDRHFTGKKHVGYVGRLDYGKGIELYLELARTYKHDDVRFTIVGTGEYEQDVRKYIDEHKLHNVEIHGFLNHEELREKYCELDVFIFPSKLEESLGLVGLEAMSCGVPVIGSNHAGIKEYVKHNLNGYTFEVGDFKSLYHHFQQFMSLSESECMQMSASAIATAKEYDSERVGAELASYVYSLA